MRARSLVATWLSFGCISALLACSGAAPPGHSGEGDGDGGPCVETAMCASHAHFDKDACRCVADTYADPGICGQGMHWDSVTCSCQKDACGGACAVGYHLDPASCTCVRDEDAGPAGCFVPGYGQCPYNTVCVTGHCPDGQPIGCECFANGGVACSSCVVHIDGGPPPPKDGGPPWDASPPPPPPPQGCYLPGYGFCPPYTTCNTGYCPDGKTPISCYCQGDGNAYCTGACPPAPPPHQDAGSH